MENGKIKRCDLHVSKCSLTPAVDAVRMTSLLRRFHVCLLSIVVFKGGIAIFAALVGLSLLHFSLVLLLDVIEAIVTYVVRTAVFAANKPGVLAGDFVPTALTLNLFTVAFSESAFLLRWDALGVRP